MPVIGSRRSFNCVIDQEGEIRLSDAEFSDLMSKGMSAAVFIMIVSYEV